MSWESRDYRSGGSGFGGGGFGAGFSGMTVNVWLMIVNFAIFVLNGVLLGAARGSSLTPVIWGNFNVEQAVYGGQVWRFLTYQFNHVDLLHFFFNMLGLYFFGPLIERWWGPKRYLAFYLLCGTAGAVVATLLAWTVGPTVMPVAAPLIGASGSLFGVLAACAVLFPRQRVQLLFPPIPMTMRTMALVFLGIAALSVIAGARNAGGEAAHLGGALLGAVLAARPGWLAWSDNVNPDTFKVKFVKQRGGAGGGGGGASAASAKLVKPAKPSRAARQAAADEAEIDRILAKVSASGLQSLTAREKKTLNQETERKRG